MQTPSAAAVGTSGHEVDPPAYPARDPAAVYSPFLRVCGFLISASLSVACDRQADCWAVNVFRQFTFFSIALLVMNSSRPLASLFLVSLISFARRAGRRPWPQRG